MCPCQVCGGDPRGYVRPLSYSPAEIVAECRLMEYAAERCHLLDEVRASRQPAAGTKPLLAWTRAV